MQSLPEALLNKAKTLVAVPTHNSREAKILIMFVNDIHPNYPRHSLPIRAFDIFTKAHFALS